MGGGREETWEKRILNGLIGFDGLPNKWVLLGNPFIPIYKNLRYPYPSIHGRVWINLVKWVDLPPLAVSKAKELGIRRITSLNSNQFIYL